MGVVVARRLVDGEVFTGVDVDVGTGGVADVGEAVVLGLEDVDAASNCDDDFDFVSETPNDAP